MKINDLSVDEIYKNFCLPNDYYYGKCHIGDEGYFGNSAEEVNKAMQENKVQKLDNFIDYNFTPFCSNDKQYKMFYILKINNKEKTMEENKIYNISISGTMQIEASSPEEAEGIAEHILYKNDYFYDYDIGNAQEE